MTACSDKEPGGGAGARVCGVIDPALVTSYVGTAHYTSSGKLDGSPLSPDCAVTRSGQLVLHAVVIRFDSSTDANKSAAGLRRRRPSMRKACPDPRFLDTWATVNVCVKSTSEISLAAVSGAYDIQLYLDNPGVTATVDQANSIAQDIAHNLAAK